MSRSQNVQSGPRLQPATVLNISHRSHEKPRERIPEVIGTVGVQLGGELGNNAVMPTQNMEQDLLGEASAEFLPSTPAARQLSLPGWILGATNPLRIQCAALAT